MTAFFDFIFSSNPFKKSDCESTISSDLTANPMNENTIKQEETTDSAKKTNSVENLALPLQLLFIAEDEAKKSPNGKNSKADAATKSPKVFQSKSARKKYNRKQRKLANSSSSEAADKSINSDNNSTLDSSEVTSPQNTVSKNDKKRQNFIKNNCNNRKNVNVRPIPSIFDPIDDQFFEPVVQQLFTQTRSQRKFEKFNPNKNQTKNQNWHQKQDFFRKNTPGFNNSNNPNLNPSNANHFNNKNNNQNLNFNLNKDPKKNQTENQNWHQKQDFFRKNTPGFNNSNNSNFNPSNANHFNNNNNNQNFNFHSKIDPNKIRQFYPSEHYNPNFINDQSLNHHFQNLNIFQNPNLNPNRYQNQSPYNYVQFRDLNVHKQFKNPKFLNNKNYQNLSKTEPEKRFKNVKKPEPENDNESSEKSFATSDTSYESKGYETNKFHYRNPNWEKKSATTNTTTSSTSANTRKASVSGQNDLVEAMFQKTNKNMRARKLLADEVVSTFENGLKVVQLMSDEECTQEEAVFQVTGSTKKVQCPVCCLSFERNDIETMLSCNHQCCASCAKNHFTEQIRNKSLKYCVCFDCDEPKWLSCDLPVGSEKVTDYFGMLDIVLRRLLDSEVHDIFQNKLRDFGLAQEENFKWCSNCSFGYFVDKTSNVKFVICENCEFVSCISCSLEWKSQHEKINCEQYKQWLEDNDENLHKTTVKDYIDKNGIVCPNCKFQYILSRGGCMHFTCHQCKYEFCYGCNKPFYRDSSKCRTSYCQKLGLHAHHPMNCLFYLRDKEPADLKRLLLANKIDFLSVCEGVTKCPIPLQKEDMGVLYDEICNEAVTSNNQAGLCPKHYVEYLAKLIRKNELETLDILTIEDLENIVLRSGNRLPPYVYGTPKDLYQKLLVEVKFELLKTTNKPADCLFFFCFGFTNALFSFEIFKFRKHYIEYLAQLIFKSKIDCISIMSAQEIESEKLRSDF